MENQLQNQQNPSLDHLPYNDLETLASILYYSFNGQDFEVKQATSTLNEMNKDLCRFADSLMKIVITDNSESKGHFLIVSKSSFIEKFMDIKNSAISLLSTSIKSTIKRTVLGPQEKLFLLECTLTTMYSPHVSLMLKLNLQLSLEELFKADSGKYLNYFIYLYIRYYEQKTRRFCYFSIKMRE